MKNPIRLFWLVNMMLTMFLCSQVNAAVISKGKLLGSKATNDTYSQEMVRDNKTSTYFKASQSSFAWIGYDFGEPYVINQICYAAPKGKGSQMLLGIFEGANNPDFSDAVPIHIIKKTPAEESLRLQKVDCSLGFRYVRYVGPHDSKCVISELRFYGNAGEGDSTHFCQLTNLPLVNIHTVKGGDITDKVNYVAGVMSIISEDGTKYYSDSLGVRGRGNGSWTFDQKPYKMKLYHKAKMLDMPAKEKKWTLINCVRDKSMIRNILAFDASRLFDMIYTPEARMVEVTLNGEYKGIYQLTDQVEVGKKRVNVTKMAPEDVTEPNISGGYLIEIDQSGGEACMFYSGRNGTQVTVHYPKSDEIVTEQKEYIRKFYNEFEKRPYTTSPLNETRGIPGRLDIESFFRRFLLGEFTANTDDWYSAYLFKERGDDQFHFSPIWDVDLGFENDTRTYPVNGYSTYLFQSGRNSIAVGVQDLLTKIISQTPYKKRLKEIWSEVRNEKGLTAEHFNHVTDSLTEYLSEAQALHFTRWPVLNTKLALNIAARGSHAAETKFVKQFIGTRIKWMDNKVGLIPSSVNKVYGSGSINAASGAIYLDGFPANSKLMISTASGLVLENSVMTGEAKQISVAPGFYMVKVTMPDSETVSKKVLVD